MDEINDEREGERYDMGIFNNFVLIERNVAAEAAADRLINEIFPQRCIRRRHSTLNVAGLVDDDVETQNQNVADSHAQIPNAKRRRASTDSRVYIAPPELRSTIDLVRGTAGVLDYRSTFHSVKDRQARIAGPASTAGTSTSTSIQTGTSASTKDVEFIDAQTDNSSTVNIDNTNAIADDIHVENAGTSTTNVTPSINPETLRQMEERLLQLRQNLGK